MNRSRLKNLKFSWIFSLILGCIYLVLVSCYPVSGKQSGSGEDAEIIPAPRGSLNPPTLGPDNGHFFTADVPGIPNEPSVNNYAWQTFIALNWPADPNQAGRIDRSTSASQFGQPDSLRPTVWQTFKLSNDVFLEDAQKPSPWGAKSPNLEACRQDAPSVHRHLFSTSKFSKTNTLDENLEATGQWLTDQNGNLVWFERLINEDEFNYIVEHQLYNADSQYRHALDEGISLPMGVSQYGDQGAIEIKAAWKELNQAEIASQRFFSLSACLESPEFGINKQAVVGLVGLHIIRKTPTFTNWMWSTFEHVDNAPSQRDLSGSKPSESGTVHSWSFYNPQSTQPPNQPPVASATPGQNLPAGPVFVGSDPTVPVQVVRQYAIPDEVNRLNRWVSAQIRSANPTSVWQYYQLVNVLWPSDPPPESELGGPAQTTPLDTYSVRSSGPSVPVANTTMETYVQDKNCTACHANAQIASSVPGQNPNLASDFSFLLGTASKPGSNQ